MGLLISYEVAGKAFHGSWSASIGSRAERSRRRSFASGERATAVRSSKHFCDLSPCLPPGEGALPQGRPALLPRSDPVDPIPHLLRPSLHLRPESAQRLARFPEPLLGGPRLPSQSRRLDSHPLDAYNPFRFSAILARRPPPLDHRPLAHRPAQRSPPKIHLQLSGRPLRHRHPHDRFQPHAASALGSQSGSSMRPSPCLPRGCAAWQSVWASSFRTSRKTTPRKSFPASAAPSAWSSASFISSFTSASSPFPGCAGSPASVSSFPDSAALLLALVSAASPFSSSRYFSRSGE